MTSPVGIEPRRILTVALLLLSLLGFPVVASGSRADTAGETIRFDRLGISFTYPSAWFVTTKPLSNGVEPVYRFAVSTFPVRRTSKDLGPCLAGIAEQRPMNGALAFLREARGADKQLDRFPKRPRHFPLPTRSDDAACLGKGTIGLPFRDSGRAFYLWISIGPEASTATRHALRRALDGMVIERR